MDYCNPQLILGSIIPELIPELIINQQGVMYPMIFMLQKRLHPIKKYREIMIKRQTNGVNLGLTNSRVVDSEIQLRCNCSVQSVIDKHYHVCHDSNTGRLWDVNRMCISCLSSKNESIRAEWLIVWYNEYHTMRIRHNVYGITQWYEMSVIQCVNIYIYVCVYSNIYIWLHYLNIIPYYIVLY